MTLRTYNTPHELGIKAISFWIDKYPEILHPIFNKKNYPRGIEIIRNNNSFDFDNINYIQNFGTAMRMKIATTYDTLTLAFLEENLYEIIGKKKYNENIKREFTKSWKRYLDDCLIF